MIKSTTVEGIVHFTSSKSIAEKECLAVGITSNGGRSILNSNNASGPRVECTPAEWDAFIAGVKAGEFD